MTMAVVSSEAFGRMLVMAGVIPADQLNRISRIVIDVKSGEGVMIYIQEFGDAGALEKLAPMLKGMFNVEG
jgi:hypothetical protein